MKQGRLGYKLVILALSFVVFVNTTKLAEIPKLEGRVDELTDEVSARDEVLDAQSAEIQVQLDELEKAETAYQGLSQQNEQLRSEAVDRESKVQRLEEKVQQQEKELEAKKQEIAKLKKAEAVSAKVATVATPLSVGNVIGNNFQVTWYNDYGHTKSGRFVKDGVTVAVDPNVIPLGTWLRIKFPDGREYIRRADDTGGKVKGHIVDIYDSSSNATLIKRGRTHGVQVSIINK